ncbi:tail collar domain [Volucribacter psittacicida]|uniref:Tail collar domain n=1 Tax=Volucribacter psittacicida TaxID=203482 RepID=A0A4R1FMB3_9PAST|nr:tail fiber protein [Volucribacter psittacicida]TCJ96126.1 tail collar domain [Volucribacter psittacicida]
MEQPKLLSKAWASNGLKNDIPKERTDSIPKESATYSEGFPQITMTPISMGGKAPAGKDMNGILNELSAHTVFLNQGGIYKFNLAFANEIGGYSKGAILINDNYDKLFISLVDKNKTNFNTSSYEGKWSIVSGVDFFVPQTQKASTSIAGIVQLVDNLLSNANNMALAAKQGRELKRLIDGLGTPFQNFSATSSLNNTTNLNDLKGAGKYGVYSQSSNSNALTALNYPEQKAGALFVLPSAYQGIQLYVPFDNQIIYIRRTNQASGFENWRIIGEVIDNLNSDSKTAGLSARQGKLLNENKANKTEVMPLQQTSLSATDDLNDFRQNGIYSQTTSARASVERNYPEAAAGVLEVLYNGNFQRYTTFNSVCYQRDYRGGSWKDWKRVDSLGKVDRAGDTITGDLKVNKTLESSYRIQIVRNEERFVPYMNVRNEAIEADSNTTDRHMTDFNMQCLRGGAEKTKALIRSYLLSDKTSRVHFMASNASDQYQNNVVIHGTGNTTIGTSTDNKTDRLQVNGSISATTMTFKGVGSTWARAYFDIPDGGNWRLEFNPNSENDPRFNMAYTTKNNIQKYVAFPTINSNRETVAYQSWVTQQFTGAVCAFAMTTPPAGWLRCNGAAVSRTTYADLFQAIGTTFGAGNGSTTFNLPDLRGEFVRGFDDGRGVDSSRGFGSWQNDEIKEHKHQLKINGVAAGNVGPWEGALHTGSGKEYSTENFGGNETRPRNVALLYCIKY